MTIYQENGYESRRAYLEDLAFNMGIATDTVFMMAAILGSNEDFDGLVTTLEDIAMDILDNE